MKILVINETLDWNDGGGCERVVTRHIQEMRDQGHEVYILGFSKEGEEEEGYIKSFTFPLSPSAREISRLFSSKRIENEISRYISDVQPDIIHLHNINIHTPAILKAIKGENVVMSVHDYNLICPTGWNLHSDMSVCPSGYNKLCRLTHKRDWSYPVFRFREEIFKKREKLLKEVVDCFVASTDELKKYLEMRGYHDVKNIQIPLGINDSEKSCEIDSSIPGNISFFGSIEKNKGVYELYREFKDLYYEIGCREVMLNFYGEGSEKEKLKQEVFKDNLRHKVFFYDKVKDTEKEMKKSRIIVVPSIWCESFGLVVTEAMSTCRQVLVSDRVGSRYLLNPSYIFNPMIKGELAFMIYLSKNEIGKQNRTLLLDNTKSDKEVVEEYIQLYKNIITLKLLE